MTKIGVFNVYIVYKVQSIRCCVIQLNNYEVSLMKFLCKLKKEKLSVSLNCSEIILRNA